MSNIIQFPGPKKKASSKKEIEDEIKKLFKESVTKESPQKTRTKGEKTRDKSMSVNGDNVIQAGGNVSINLGETKTIKKVLPNDQQIGGETSLKNGIQNRFKKLAEYRAKSRGNSKAAIAQSYQIMYRIFKRDFGIPEDGFNEIWLYPVSCAEDIIAYLDRKIALTVQGRLDEAIKRKDYVHKRPWLYQMEEDYAHILCLSGNERKKILKQWFGVESRSQLTDNQHWQFMNYLRLRIESLDEY
ncbi:hypothetical protein ACNO5E_26120 [Vibrio parahaemolyticus]|jgi:hypothetical protein